MGPKRIIPQREQAVCGRLREFRLSTKLTRAAFARELGLGYSRLKNYERAQAPIPYSIGSKLCGTMNVSQQWLATGEGQMSAYITISPQIEAQIPARMWFTAAYDKFIEPTVLFEPPSKILPLVKKAQPDLERMGLKIDLLRNVGSFVTPAIRVRLARELGRILEALPAHLVWPYYWRLMALADEFIHPQKKDVDDLSLKGQTHNVSELSQLLAEVNRRVRARGEKSALARYLSKKCHRRVTPARVSEWLSGKKEPGGEVTLQLRNWVRAQEPKQKAAGA